MDRILINWENMDQYSSIPLAYRFVDQAEVIPGKEAWGKKAVSSLDWYFQVHFPGNPVMPGVLLMEVMQQTGMLIVTTMPEADTDLLLFHACEAMRMYRSVRPGDVLSAHVTLESFCHGVAKLNGGITVFDELEKANKTVCTMKFTLISENGMIALNSKKFQRGRVDGKKRFNWENMDCFTSDPLGYRFVEQVDVVSGEAAWGEKSVSMLDWYISLAGRKNPMMPWPFVAEAIMQTCVFVITSQQNTGSTLRMFHGCRDLTFHRIVRPGERLVTYAKLERQRGGVADCSGFAAVDEELVCEMKFTIFSPELLVKVRV